MTSEPTPSVNPKAAYGVAVALFALAVVNIAIGVLFQWFFLILAVVWLAIGVVWVRLVRRARRRELAPPDPDEPAPTQP